MGIFYCQRIDLHDIYFLQFNKEQLLGDIYFHVLYYILTWWPFWISEQLKKTHKFTYYSGPSNEHSSIKLGLIWASGFKEMNEVKAIRKIHRHM